MREDGYKFDAWPYVQDFSSVTQACGMDEDLVQSWDWEACSQELEYYMDDADTTDGSGDEWW